MVIRKKSGSFKSLLYLAIDSYLLNIVYFKGNISIQQALLFLIMFSYVFLNFDVIKKTNQIFQTKNAIKIALQYLYVLVIGAFFPILHQTFDFSYITMYAFNLIGWTLKLLVIVIHNEKMCNGKEREDSFMMVVVRSMLIYVFVSVLMMLIPSFRTVIVNSIYSTDLQEQLLRTSAYYTRIGWSGISVYGHSMRCSLAAFFSLFLFLKKNFNHEKNTGKFLIYFLLCSMGCFFYARTGLIVNLILFLLSLLVLIKSGLTKAFSKEFMAMLVIIVALLGLLLLSENNDSLSWAMSIFNDVKTGSIQTTISGLWSVLFVRVAPEDLLIGSGYYTSTSGMHYMSTDSGFMRNTLFMGVLPSIILYLFLIKSIVRFVKKHNRKLYSFSLMALVFLLTIFEMKGEAYPFLFPCILLISHFRGNLVERSGKNGV